MLDASKIKHLSHQTVYELSCKEWIGSSWNLAVSGITVDKTSVLSTDDGIWRIWCESLCDVASLRNTGEIIQRLHQLNDIRPLPKISVIVPIPPSRFGSVMAMLRSLPYQKMPDSIWQSFAWSISVDSETANSSELTSIKNGIWTIRCHSEHAWKVLQNPQPILNMLNYLHTLKQLPEIKGIRPVLGNLKPADIKPVQSVQECIDCSDIPDFIDDPKMRQLLARIQNARKQKNHE